jgi:hypothetical protein
MFGDICKIRRESSLGSTPLLAVPVFKPEFVRLPRPGNLCPYSGLARTALYTLCAEGKVDSKVIRQPGATRGIRIIVYDSLMKYLHSLESSQSIQRK